MASSTQGMRDAGVRRDDDRPAVRTSPSQLLALIVGLAFTAAGIAGFFVTGTEDFTHHDTGETLLGLEITGNGYTMIAADGGAFVFGLFAVDEEDINFLSLNDADNWFHLASAAVGLIIALLPATRAYRDSRSTTAR